MSIKRSLTNLHRTTREISATATSTRHAVVVTVGPNGVVTDIRFPAGAFRRMTTGELSSALMTAYNEAKRRVMR